MSEPQDVLQALREALAGKKKKAIPNNTVKTEDEDVGPQKVKSKNLS